MNRAELPFTIPVELVEHVDDHVLEIHGEFSQLSYKHVLEVMDEISSEDGIILREGDPEAGVNVLSLPFQQSWKPSMMIRSFYHALVNNPDGVSIFLPNNSISDESYQLSSDDMRTLESGDMTTFFEIQARKVENALNRYDRIGKLTLDGYSQGGLTALGMASSGFYDLEVERVHSIEAPNKETTSSALRKDFMKSGGSVGGAIKDTNLPVLSRAMNPSRLGKDFAIFGIASLVNKGNAAIHKSMASPKYLELIDHAIDNYPDIDIVAGHIEGSVLFDPNVTENIEHPGYSEFYIGKGEGSRGHATGDNVVAHALMMRKN